MSTINFFTTSPTPQSCKEKSSQPICCSIKSLCGCKRYKKCNIRIFYNAHNQHKFLFLNLRISIFNKPIFLLMIPGEFFLTKEVLDKNSFHTLKQITDQTHAFPLFSLFLNSFHSSLAAPSTHFPSTLMDRRFRQRFISFNIKSCGMVRTTSLTALSKTSSLFL